MLGEEESHLSRRLHKELFSTFTGAQTALGAKVTLHHVLLAATVPHQLGPCHTYPYYPHHGPRTQAAAHSSSQGRRQGPPAAGICFPYTPKAPWGSWVQ